MPKNKDSQAFNERLRAAAELLESIVDNRALLAGFRRTNVPVCSGSLANSRDPTRLPAVS